jgi:hypothetical protein
MAYAVRNYRQGLRTASIKYARDDRPYVDSHLPNETMGEALRRHIGNAGRHLMNHLGRRRPNSCSSSRRSEPERKFDACMADILANEARLDVLASKQLNKMTGRSTSFQRIR